jgi:hypothetical protein
MVGVLSPALYFSHFSLVAPDKDAFAPAILIRSPRVNDATDAAPTDFKKSRLSNTIFS